MSLTYGFYNSMEHDRMYNALQVSQLFDGLIENGVYETIGDALMVTENTGMTVDVNPGRAWFDHTWTLNDAIYPLVLDSSDSIVSRYDAIVLDIDGRRDIRKNSLMIVKGTPGADNPDKPELIKEENHHQYPLAYIFVAADATEIRQADIENCVGTSECPFVTGVVSAMDADWLYAQWNDEWKRWMASIPAELESMIADFTEWKAEQKKEFLVWFESLQITLDGDVAGHLQNEIDELKALWPITNVPYTLYKDLWTDDVTYSLEADYPSDRFNILNVYVPTEIEQDEYDAMMDANVYGYNEENILIGHGEKPDVDIPVVLQIIRKGVVS